MIRVYCDNDRCKYNTVTNMCEKDVYLDEWIGLDENGRCKEMKTDEGAKKRMIKKKNDQQDAVVDVLDRVLEITEENITHAMECHVNKNCISRLQTLKKEFVRLRNKENCKITR